MEDTKRYEFKGTLRAHRKPPVPGCLHETRSEAEEQHLQPEPVDGLGEPWRSASAREPIRPSTTRAFSRRVSSLKDAIPIAIRASSDRARNIPTLIRGTLLLDRSRGNTRYWTDTFCGVCDTEKRDNDDFFGKAEYFLSTKRFGSHSMTFGYDLFNDKRFANNHQSGSDYRILGTSSIIQGAGTAAVIYPQFLGDGTTIIQWNPIPLPSVGSNFRTHSAFYNNAWRVTKRLTANLGVRYDKNDGQNQQGETVVTDDAWSPRLGCDFRSLWNRRMVGNGERREIRDRHFTGNRRRVVGWRQLRDASVPVPRSEYQSCRNVKSRHD